jgi:AraC family transcriptional regulator of adaptative response / DNA-3-methyladenine glycosylase II
VQKFGTRVRGLELFGLTHTFPAADTLADADLGRLDLTRTEQETIHAFARAVAEDVVRFDRSVSLEQLIETLGAVGAIDTQTAHWIALRLGEPDACPIESTRAESWRPWRAVATMHLSQQSTSAADRTAA